MEPRRLTLWRAVLGLAAALVAVAWIAADLLAEARSERAGRQAAVAAAGGAAELANRLDQLLHAVADPTRAATDLGALAAVQEVDGTAGLARDTGEAHLSPPFEQDGTTVVVALSARYDGSPTTTTERRAALTGFALEQVDVAGLVEGSSGDVEVRVADGDAEQTGAGDEVAAVAVSAGGRRWSVVATHGSGAGAGPTVILTTGVAAAGAVLVAGRRAQLRRRRHDAALASASDRSNLVAEAGAVLHRSLDLGEVLPALGLQLVDAFDLAGLEILVSDDAGDLGPTFAIGTVGSVPGSRALEIPLERHGRTVGALRLATRRAPTAADVETLRAIGELTASAIANIHAFEDEQETVRRLAELDELKTDFLATVSHELSTPVTAIKGFSSLLANSWESIPEDQRRDQVARIARNAASLGELVRGLLEFARMERRSLRVEREDHDLSEVVTTVVAQTASLLDDHELVVDAPRPVPASIDPYAVERIVANLLTNAGKFSPPGTPIVVGVRSNDGHAVLTVTDRGPGIPVEERGHIFSRFYRGTGQHTVRTRGAGVGLAVVRELVDRMGATITIGDTQGGGATFTVAFQAADMTNGAITDAS